MANPNPLMRQLFPFAVGLALLGTGCAARSEAVATNPPDYFPPPESQGGWRKLEGSLDIQRLTGMDSAKLEDLKQWLLKSDDRPFNAIIIRYCYVVLDTSNQELSLRNEVFGRTHPRFQNTEKPTVTGRESNFFHSCSA